MKYHWKRYELNSTKLSDGSKLKRYVSYLFDSNGNIQGRVQNTATGVVQGYAGRPARLIGVFESNEVAEAKAAVLNEVKMK